jgi:hypothetical protein
MFPRRRAWSRKIASGVLDRLARRVGEIGLFCVATPLWCRAGQMNDTSIAQHEAGHTVASYRFGHRPISVNILQTGTRGGQSLAENEWPWGETAYAGHIITVLAGYAAQVAHGEDEGSARTCSADDFARAGVWIGLLREDVETWVERARGFVIDNASAIRALATELIRRRELGREDIARVIEAADAALLQDQAQAQRSRRY